MSKILHRLNTPGVYVLTALLVAIGWFALFALGSASADEHVHDPSDLDHHHGFSGPGDVAEWPPRPQGANENMVVFDPLPEDPLAAPMLRSGPAISEAAEEASALAEDFSPALSAALGDDWVLISSSDAIVGKDGTLPAEDSYFSRSNNQTVRVIDGVVQTFDAAELQPLIAPAERAEAAELGRQWLIEQGYEVDGLEGFGIRPLDHGRLYSVRMVYVTYATSWFDDPVLSALVDLTNGEVVEGGLL